MQSRAAPSFRRRPASGPANDEKRRVARETEEVLEATTTRSGGRNDEGQALVEYALLLMLIATVAVGVLTAIGVEVVEPFAEARDALT